MGKNLTKTKKNDSANKFKASRLLVYNEKTSTNVTKPTNMMK